jgi:hypothetical protein
MSSISRRSLVTTAAALPALAVPAVASGIAPSLPSAFPADDLLVALADEVFNLWNVLGDACDVTDAAWFDGPDHVAAQAAQDAINDRIDDVVEISKRRHPHRKSTAYHEAGHAVIARVLTLASGPATIKPDYDEGIAGFSITDVNICEAEWEKRGKVRFLDAAWHRLHHDEHGRCRDRSGIAQYESDRRRRRSVPDRVDG